MKFPFSNYYIFALILFISLISSKIQAQGEFPVFFEPDIKLNYGPDTQWSHSFAIGNRELIFVDNEFYFEARYLEFTHFTKYELNDRHKFGLGIRYRFREVFDNLREDEIRFMEQYEYSRSFTNFNLSHEVRLEQRFRERNTFRTRYELAFEFPLGDDLENADTFLTAATEALWSMGKEELPAFEQRFTVELEKDLSVNTAGNIGVEYRYGDYTRRPTNEFYIIAGLAIDI